MHEQYLHFPSSAQGGSSMQSGKWGVHKNMGRQVDKCPHHT
jgi:hypothetical protein